MIRSYLKLYFTVLLTILLAVGLLNCLIDPLWYGKGNQLTGVNPPWNERIAKTNLFLQDAQSYDCLLLGTSRATLLNTTFLQNNHCFNYAFSGGKLEELVNYAAYIQQKQVHPVKVYVEIEPSSLNRRSQARTFAAVTDPAPRYQTYFFSLNTFWLSLKTIFQLYPYARLYGPNFQVQLSEDIPRYEPEFSVENEDHKGCAPRRIQLYQRLQQIFPEASWVGFVAPVSAWRVYNEQYANGLLACQLQGIHQLSGFFDAIYDFSVPSVLTQKTNNTYDGNHYYPAVFQTVADVLEGRQTEFGVNVNQYALSEYQTLYKRGIQAFLARLDEEERWRG
jgi:hypothetical protein